MTIDISPEIEARLKAKAHAEGVSVGAYVERLVFEEDARRVGWNQFLDHNCQADILWCDVVARPVSNRARRPEAGGQRPRGRGPEGLPATCPIGCVAT